MRGGQLKHNERSDAPRFTLHSYNMLGIDFCVPLTLFLTLQLGGAWGYDHRMAAALSAIEQHHVQDIQVSDMLACANLLHGGLRVPYAFTLCVSSELTCV